MNRLTEELRAGLRQEASGVPTLGDMDQAIRYVDVTRRRWAGGVSLVVVLLLVGSWLVLLRPPTVEPAVPTPEPSVAASGPSRLLPPTCGRPEYAARAPAPYDDPRPCPATLPVGPNYGYVTGGHMIRDVVLDIPGKGWSAQPLAGSLEVISPAGNAVTVVAYPRLVAVPTPDSPPGSALLEMIQGLADVQVRDSGTTTLGGRSFTWMDLAVAPDAELSDGCRLEAPCLPLIRAYGAAAGELRPGRVARLLIGESMGNVPVAIWVHDITGPDADAALHVADTITLSTAHE